MPLDTGQDLPALTCADIQWERIGLSAAPLPGGLWTASGSVHFFNSGARSWYLIDKNKPLPQSSWASASPAGPAASSSSPALTQEFSVRAKNTFGVVVVSIRYRFTVQSGSGPGASDRCISRLGVAPVQLEVAAGWSVSMTVLPQQPLEYAEAGAAIAVLPVKIELAIETKLKRNDVSKMHLGTPTGVFFA